MISNNQIALCNNLNMNFDEASELFCEESLNSMQCARVNGGFTWGVVLRELLKAIGIDAAIEAIKTAWNKLYGPTSPTPASQNMTITRTVTVGISDANVEFEANGNSFSLNIKNVVVTSTTTTAPTK